MADKASRGMVVYGDGLARFINESHTHLHALASRAFCGFLSLPISPPSETEDARIAREFAQIIDAYEAYHDTCGEDAICLVPSISDRFMGMRSAIITNNSSLKTFGGKLGCTVLQLSNIIDDNHPNADLPIDVVASELLKLLGFQEGKTSETSRFDLVFIHIGDGENNSKKDTEYVNHLVGQIMHIADTGSEISSRLHMSVVMSYGTVSEDDDTNLSFVCGDGNNSDLTLLFPCQSYMVKGWNLRNNVSMVESLQYRLIDLYTK